MMLVLDEKAYPGKVVVLTIKKEYNLRREFPILPDAFQYIKENGKRRMFAR